MKIAGIVDRKDEAVKSHTKYTKRKAFVKSQVDEVREIQNNLLRNYNGSKVTKDLGHF